MKTQNMKRQYNLNQWASIIKACKASGLTVKVWCDENNINRNKFYYWQRLIREDLCNRLPVVEESSTTTFVKLNNHTINNNSNSFQPDIVIKSGDLQIELSNNTSPRLFEDVMKVMRRV